MARIGPVVKCPEGQSLRAVLKRKKFWFHKDRPDHKWPTSAISSTQGATFVQLEGYCKVDSANPSPKKRGGGLVI